MVSFIHRVQFLGWLLLSVLLVACSQSEDGGPSVANSVEAGRLLATQHCIACHQLPAPDLLPKESWEYALTYMGFFLGIVDYQYMEGSPESALGSIHLREEFVRDANLLPDAPLMSNEDWTKLRAYYIAEAPKKAIPQITKPVIIEDTEKFRVKPTQYRMESAITSMVHIDEENGLLYIHDGRSEQLTVLDRNLNFHDSHPSPGVSLVEAQAVGEDLYLLSIGDLFASNIGAKLGEFQQTRVFGGVFMGLNILVKDLHRPADFAFADLDNDGLDELLVSNFGDYTGNFSIYGRDSENGAYATDPLILSDQPGIVKGDVHDFNEDGYLDIVVMMSAARENVSVFLNDKNGTFTQNVLWEKHPSFGYIGFELKDFNGDGQMDLLTLNGDNGDSDTYNTLKRDHGIRLYLNKGNLQFEESYFYPMYGVYGAEVADFDHDGDLDIAAISYHPDFDLERPENFVYLEQVDSLEFTPFTHPATQKGRWLSIDSGDADGDGDQDIVLGAAYVPVGMREKNMDKFEKLVSEGPPILVLENRMGK